MSPQVKSGIWMGLAGGAVVVVFAGASVAVVGVIIGVALGLTLGSHVERKNPVQTALEAWPAATVAGGLVLVISLLTNYVISNLVGRSPSEPNVVILANLVGLLGLVFFAGVTTGLHALPPAQERIGKLVLLAFLVATFPFVDAYTGLRWGPPIILALIFVILALGLNIVVGFAGLLDLGYAAFFAIGAYAAGLLNSPVHGIFINFWIVIWIAAAMAGVWGLILGAPTLRLRGDYLAIVTLGFGEIVPVVFRNLIDVTMKEPITCWILPGLLRLFGANAVVQCITILDRADLTKGEQGINPIGRPVLPFIGEFQSDNPIPWYFLIIGILLLSVFLIRRLRDSRTGRMWMALREDELAASQMGIDPVRTKLLAFSMGAMFSGFAGAFYGAYVRGIFPSAFEFAISITVLVMVILGGLGNITGVIVGGLVISLADRLFLPALKEFLSGLLNTTILPALASNPTLQSAVSINADPILYRYLLFGLTLVIMMAVRPEGLIPSARRRAELHAADEAPNVAAVAEGAPAVAETGQA